MVWTWVLVGMCSTAPSPQGPPASTDPEPPKVQRPSNWAGPGSPVREPVPPAATPPTTAIPAPQTERANAPTTAIPAPQTERANAPTAAFPAPQVDRANAPVQAQPAPPVASASSPTTSTVPPSVDSIELAPVGGGERDVVSLRRPPPAPGTGLIVGGAGLIGAGALTSVVGMFAVGFAAEGGAPSPGGYAVLGLGLVAAGGGAAMLTFGVKRRSRYRLWMRDQGLTKGKPAGHGLLVGGPMVMGGGAAFLASGIGTGDVAFSLAGAGIVVGGIGMTAAGAVRKKKYTAWAGRFELTNAVPSVSPIERGAMVGWSGRF